MKKSPYDLKNQRGREFERRHIEMQRKQNEKIKNPIEVLINTNIEILTGGMLSFNPPQRIKPYYKRAYMSVHRTRPQVLDLPDKTLDKTKNKSEGFITLMISKIAYSLGIKYNKDDYN